MQEKEPPVIHDWRLFSYKSHDGIVVAEICFFKEGVGRMHDIHILTHCLISEADMMRLNALRTALNDEYGTLTHESIHTETQSGNNIIFVARAESCIIGMIALQRSGVDTTHRTGIIKSFIVDERHRQSGIGTQLLTRALKVADLSGVKTLSLRARPDRVHARALYKKFGFCTTVQSPTEFLRKR